MKSLEESIVKLVQEHLDYVHSIYLFGSRADGKYVQPNSDWDVAVLSKDYKGFSALEIWNNQLEIAAKLDIELDLVDLRNVSTIFQYEILKSCRILWTEDEVFARLFEARLLGEYQDFHESQKLNLQEIVLRGSVYGA